MSPSYCSFNAKKAIYTVHVKARLRSAKQADGHTTCNTDKLIPLWYIRMLCRTNHCYVNHYMKYIFSKTTKINSGDVQPDLSNYIHVLKLLLTNQATGILITSCFNIEKYVVVYFILVLFCVVLHQYLLFMILNI